MKILTFAVISCVALSSMTGCVGISSYKEGVIAVKHTADSTKVIEYIMGAIAKLPDGQLKIPAKSIDPNAPDGAYYQIAVPANKSVKALILTYYENGTLRSSTTVESDASKPFTESIAGIAGLDTAKMAFTTNENDRQERIWNQIHQDLLDLKNDIKPLAMGFGATALAQYQGRVAQQQVDASQPHQPGLKEIVQQAIADYLSTHPLGSPPGGLPKSGER